MQNPIDWSDGAFQATAYQSTVVDLNVVHNEAHVQGYVESAKD